MGVEPKTFTPNEESDGHNEFFNNIFKIGKKNYDFIK